MKKKLGLLFSLFALFSSSMLFASCGEIGSLVEIKAKNKSIEIVYGTEFNTKDFGIFATYESGTKIELEEKTASTDGFTYNLLKNGFYYYANINGIPEVGNYSFTIKYEDKTCNTRLIVSPATPESIPSLQMSTTEFQYLSKYPQISFSNTDVISTNANIELKYDELNENGEIVNAGKTWDFSHEDKNTVLLPGKYQLYAVVTENGNYKSFTTNPVRFIVKKATLSLQDYRLYRNGYNDITVEFSYDPSKTTLKDYNDVLNEQIKIMYGGNQIHFGNFEFVDGDTIIKAKTFNEGQKFSIICKSEDDKFEDLKYTNAISLSITPYEVSSPMGIAFEEGNDQLTVNYDGSVHKIEYFNLVQSQKPGTKIFIDENNIEVFEITDDSTLSATEASVYKVNFALLDKENFVWDNDSTENISFEWEILPSVQAVIIL